MARKARQHEVVKWVSSGHEEGSQMVMREVRAGRAPIGCQVARRAPSGTNGQDEGRVVSSVLDDQNSWVEFYKLG